MNSGEEDVKQMVGNPQQTIRKMSIPLTVAILIDYIQNFIDTVWCSGLGSAAISAITVAGPLYWVIIDLGIGFGVGASTAISRKLGAGNKEKADGLAMQAVAFSVVISLIATLALVVICDPVLEFINNGGDISLCRDYVLPYFICIIPIVLHGVILSLIRSEGAGKKVLQLSVASAAINIIIDPLLIFTLNLGVMGAAIATCISFTVPLVIALVWYARKSMYLRLSLKGFRFKKDEIWDIVYVGIPHMFELMAISLLMIPQNMLVLKTGGDEGVVLAMTPFKFIILAMMPAQGLAQAMIPVTSATQGAGDMAKTKSSFLYTIRLTTIICLLLALVLFVFADPLTYLFSYSGDMAHYHDKMTDVLRLYSIITLFAGLNEIFSGILQSLRRPILATVTTFTRESVFIGMYVIASGIGMEAIYYSMVLGMLFGAVLMGLFAAYCIRQIRPIVGTAA